MAEAARVIQRHHHITLCVGVAQEDYDFHTKVLGMKSVKKTALYDGDVPIYHLYYGNDHGDESTLVTCFPMRQSGRVGRPGVNQTKVLMLSVPDTSLGYWRERLVGHGFEVTEREALGEKRLSFSHPCGIDYEVVGVSADLRLPHSNGPVPVEFGVHGTHGITVSVRDLDLAADFMNEGWDGVLAREDGDRVRFEVGEGGPGAIVDFEVDTKGEQAGWKYGEGIVHHTAFQVADHDIQSGVKSRLEGLGFTDVSERKDRGYFDSVYVRTPTGALFEATVSKPQGFLIDEPYEGLGRTFQVPPQFADQRDFLMSYLEPLSYA
ncbi:MAG: VOC family protein [Acidimicrobiales bacterium]